MLFIILSILFSLTVSLFLVKLSDRQSIGCRTVVFGFIGACIGGYLGPNLGIVIGPFTIGAKIIMFFWGLMIGALFSWFLEKVEEEKEKKKEEEERKRIDDSIERKLKEMEDFYKQYKQK